jgi:membrane-anchored protein YejM (alkaline phosphatase superfamily)
MKKDDRLEVHRDASKRKDDNVFFSWLSSNCTHAKPISEVRKLTSNIKETIREELKDDDS